jgi:hypothetical protein
VLAQRRRELACAAPDIEHAPPAQVAFAYDDVVDLPPRVVRRPERVVARRARREVGITRRR